MLKSIGSQRVRHNLATEQQQIMKETFKRFEQKNEGTLSAAFSFVLKPLK